MMMQTNPALTNFFTNAAADAAEGDASRYLDYSAYIRSLGEAEEAHNLDNQGAIDALTAAANSCDAEAGRYQRRADEYMLAKAAYFAEIKRRVGLPAGGQPGKPKGGLNEWCRANNQARGYVYRLISVAEAPDPVSQLNKLRLAYRQQQNRRNKIDRAILLEARAASSNRDPLSTVKREWYKLSPVQRSAFMLWVYQQTPEKEAAD